MSWKAMMKIRLQLKILMLAVLLAHLGTYMIIPLLPIFLKVEKGMSIAQIGIILAVSPFTFQLASLLGGWLSDRIGRRRIIAAGAWLNAMAIAGFAWFDDYGLFISMGLLSGIGVGLHAPSIKAAIAAIADEDDSDTFAFSLRGIAANAGIAAAGLLTYFVLGGSSPIIFYVSAAIYLFVGVAVWLFVRKGCGDAPCVGVPLREYKAIFRNHAFVAFSIVSILIWALYHQLAISLPLRAEVHLAQPSMIALIWTLNSVLVILLQSWLSSWVIAKLQPMYTLFISMLFIGTGLGSLFWATSFLGFVLSGVIFIIGEMLLMPTMDSAVSRMGTNSMIGAYFGLSNFVAGVGEGVGKFLGGQLLALGTDSLTPWLLYALGGIFIALLLLGLQQWRRMREALSHTIS